MARAFSLENELAKYPRIVVDDRIFDTEINNNSKYFVELVTAENGLRYIDYLMCGTWISDKGTIKYHPHSGWFEEAPLKGAKSLYLGGILNPKELA